LRLTAVHLVGHSLGGAVALFFAAARPERVRSLTAIESLGPGGGAPENAVTRLRRYVADLAKPSRKRTYPTLEAAVARVRERNTGLSEQVAWQLTRFGTRQMPSGGYQFTFDPAHRKRFGFAFDEEQILAVLNEVQCKVQVIHATSGLTFDDEAMKARLSKLGSPTPILLEGSHHVHMDRPAEVAAHIADFIHSLP
jgi:pimeloyl-ACP methyl ester carboxylesterase